MSPRELINSARQNSGILRDSAVYNSIVYSPAENNADNETYDANLHSRTEIVRALLSDFSIADLPLIRMLFDAEMACEMAIEQHENMYQICFYLFELGQMEDVFRLYDAKYGTRHWDISIAMDREMITAGHEPEVVIHYVAAALDINPELQKKYSGFIKDLQGLIDQPDYASLADYRNGLRSYFLT